MHDLGEEAFGSLKAFLQDEWAAQNMKQYGRFVRRSVDVMQHYGLKKDHFYGTRKFIRIFSRDCHSH